MRNMHKYEELPLSPFAEDMGFKWVTERTGRL